MTATLRSASLHCFKFADKFARITHRPGGRTPVGGLLEQYYSSVTGNAAADRALQTLTGGRLETWLQKYERLVGLAEVREAQNKVIQVYLYEITLNINSACF